MLEELKNRKEIVEELTEILMDFDRKKNKYQTDVYLYYDEETQTAKLDTFANVGGNSWLNDDHYTIYRDTEHYDDWEDWYCNEGDFARGLDKDQEEFENEVKDFLDLDDDEKEDYKPEWYEERDYVRSREDYADTLYALYVDNLKDYRVEYEDNAERIISEWEEETEREEQIKAEGGEAWNKFMGH